MAGKYFLAIGIILAAATSSSAQFIGGSVGADSVSNAVIPIIAYSSNEGLVGGGLYNRYDYSGNIRPFNNYLSLAGVVSTKGFIEFAVTYEQTRSFGSAIRSIYEGYFERFTSDIFFGIGNGTDFSRSRWENNYYYFKSIGVGFSYKARYSIFKQSGSQLDLQGGIGTTYQDSYIKNRPSSFAAWMPNGARGGWVNTLNAGFIWENRDSEFDPQHGNRAEVEFRWAPHFASTYALTTTRLELRQYFQLFNSITVANRLEGRHVTGDVPYWELATLGGNNNLRGYPLNRFQGNSSVAYTLELRSWFLRFPSLYNLKLGAQLFTDTGRVFTAQDDINDLFHGYKQTIGLGGAMSIFNPDFVLRGEIGFSEEVARIYVNVGYLF